LREAFRGARGQLGSIARENERKMLKSGQKVVAERVEES